MLNELTRLTYLSFYLWESGTRGCGFAVYEAAEDALNCTVDKAEVSGVWRLPPEHTGTIERVLAAYDEQIATVSAKAYMQAVFRLGRVLSNKESRSPVAKLAEAKSTMNVSLEEHSDE
ncbi:hypothetical protein A9R05_39825 (plasmid) [Burkholderia sp. KK1]|nr:hypothetical protein A9R05_39825 [Burkholderia sp. KK1]